jgi:hypothetical protein
MMPINLLPLRILFGATLYLVPRLGRAQCLLSDLLNDANPFWPRKTVMLHEWANSLKSNNLMHAVDRVLAARRNVGNLLGNVGNGFHLLTLDFLRTEHQTRATLEHGR